MKHIRPFLPRMMDTDYYAWSLKLTTFNALLETTSSFYLDLVTVKEPEQNTSKQSAVETTTQV